MGVDDMSLPLLMHYRHCNCFHVVGGLWSELGGECYESEPSLLVSLRAEIHSLMHVGSLKQIFCSPAAISTF